MLISVVIPVLNETETIGSCLRQFEREGDVEVIIVDGGSTDGSREIAEALGIGKWIACPDTGRAVQMNHGASVSKGYGLLFLHADTILPPCALDRIRESLRDPEVAGGRFSLGFGDGNFVYALVGMLSTLRSRFLNITYGDQGIFARRSVFRDVGGFPGRRIFEDSEFCEKLSRIGKLVLLPDRVRTSTRRWRRSGFVKTVVLMWGLRLLNAMSVPDSHLSRCYRDLR